MHELPWITIFWSRVRWFVNDFHEWRSHEWKSLANHITIDQKVVIHGNELLFYFLHAILCPEHTIPLKQSSIAYFVIVAKDGLFWLTIVTSHDPEVLALCRHIPRLFMHAQIGTKAIFTSE